MCDNIILKNGGTFRFVPDCCKNKKMCNRAVDIHAHALIICNQAVDTPPSAMQFVPECYKTQEVCNKAVDTCLFVFDS